MRVLKLRVRVVSAVLAVAVAATTVIVPSGSIDASIIHDRDDVPGGGKIKPLPRVGPPYCDLDGYPKYIWNPLGDYYATDTGVVADEIGESDGSPFYLQRLVSHWCTDENGNGQEKFDVFFISIINPDTVAFSYDLYAKVKARLPDPIVDWKDLDAEHGWLWVNVEHRIGVEPLAPIYEKESAGNWMAGYATAWVQATASEVTIELPDAPDVELAACDLADANSAQGCRIVFRHSSSIAPGQVFHGKITMRWDVTSNSGKYNGRVITTENDFEIAVAEAMAVSSG